MKLSNKYLNIFKKECKKWIDILKLDNWEVYYDWQDKEGTFASIYTDLSGYVATIFLTRDWEDLFDHIEEQIKRTAKHEVIHLLLSRLSDNARSRFIAEADLGESEEELVRKLEKIIK